MGLSAAPFTKKRLFLSRGRSVGYTGIRREAFTEFKSQKRRIFWRKLKLISD
jgi:hypothetical protein